MTKLLLRIINYLKLSRRELTLSVLKRSLLVFSLDISLISLSQKVGQNIDDAPGNVIVITRQQILGIQ
jgi:hypothetical protein